MTSPYACICPSIHLYSHPYIQTEGGGGGGGGKGGWVGRKGNPDMATWVKMFLQKSNQLRGTQFIVLLQLKS